MSTTEINPKSCKPSELFEQVTYYLDPLHDHLLTISTEEKMELKKSYARFIQIVIRSVVEVWMK